MIAYWQKAQLTVKCLIIISICWTGFVLLRSSIANAAPVVDNIPAGEMPTDIETYLLNCGYTDGASAQVGWLSLAGQPTTTVTSVAYGTPSISLQYNTAVIVCDSSRTGGLITTNNGIIDTTPSDLGLTGSTISNSYGASTGSYNIASKTFIYTLPGTFITDTTVTVSLQEKRINIYRTSPIYRCVTNAGDINPRKPTSGTDYGACISVGLPVVSVKVNVTKPTPQVSCTVANSIISVGDAYTPRTVVAHSGPTSAPTVDLAGSITVQGQTADSVSGSVANGASTTLIGSAHTINAAGTYTVNVAVQATSSWATANIVCSGTLTVKLPDPIVTCSINSPSISAGDSTNLTLTINHTGPAQAPQVNYTATVSIDTKANQTFTGTLQNGTSTDITTASMSFGAGLYKVLVSVTGSAGGCDGVISSLERPYIRTYNNDVLAGFGFYNAGGTCPTSVGDVTAFTRGAAQSYSGSGSQLGTVASGQISGFRSASTLASAAALPEILSFANTILVNITSGNYGGSYGSGSCMYDYWQSSVNAQIVNDQILNISTLASGRYYIRQTTGAPVNLSGQIANGRRIVMYIEGTALLRGAALGYVSKAWASASDIPSLYIIAKGNIAVGSDVLNLDGHFLAQRSNNTDGRILSCTDPATGQTYASAPAHIANCSTRLNVNGSFNAEHINFLRTFSSVTQSNPGEPASTSKAAEIFSFPIESYISTQNIDNIKQQTYDSITALPPSL